MNFGDEIFVIIQNKIGDHIPRKGIFRKVDIAHITIELEDGVIEEIFWPEIISVCLAPGSEKCHKT